MPTTDSSIEQRSSEDPSATIDRWATQSRGQDPGVGDAVGEQRSGEKARVREDWPARMIELERRVGIRHQDVRVVVSGDGADVGPVVVKQVRLHAVPFER